MHLIQDISLAKTLISKSEWEKSMDQSGHIVKNYHADNGCFADNGYIDAINEKYPNIKLCGIGAHYHNGIFENTTNAYARIQNFIDSCHAYVASND